MKQPTNPTKPTSKLAWKELLGAFLVATSLIALAFCHSTTLMVLLAAISVLSYIHLVSSKPKRTPEP